MPSDSSPPGDDDSWRPGPPDPAGSGGSARSGVPGGTGRHGGPFPAASAGGFVLVALLLVALNLRGPIASLPPVVDEVARSLGLTAGGAGLLTSIPVLCFALLTPGAARMVARLGPERALLLAMLGVLAGTIVRPGGTVPAAVVGTALIGAGITVGNVAVPVIITRDFLRRVAAVSSAYTSTMNLGSTFTTMLTAPLAVALGWQWALAGWGLLAVVALVVWVPAGRRLSALHDGTPSAGRRTRPGVGATTSRRLVVLLALAFAGQSSGYYAMTAWLPSILGDRVGLDVVAAGSAAAPFQLAAVAGSFLVPVGLASRLSERTVVTTLSLMWLSLPVGLLVAPGGWLLWVALAGAAQGGCFTAMVMLIAQRSPTVAASRRTSAVVQTAGYACAATAPTVLGAVHEATHGWTAPVGVVVGLISLMAVALWFAAAPARR